MRTGLQIFIDKKIGPAFNLILYTFVRITGKILRIDHRLDKPFKRIVICKYKGLGSIVQASALISTLKKNYPDAEIRFLSTTGNKGILDFYRNYINDDILIDDGSAFKLFKTTFSAILKLWKFKPEIFIDLEVYSNFSTFICTISAAKNRFGFYKSDKDYRTGLFTHLMYYNIKAPLSEIYLQMARLLPINQIDHKLIFPESNSETELHLTQILTADGYAGQEFIVINPNASDLRLERRWPKNSYSEIIKQLRIKFPEISIILVGNKAETAYVNSIHNDFSTDNFIINSSGKLSLAELVTLISKAKIVITNDTGPLHISLSLNKTTIGLFGPCSPSQYGQMETCTPIYENVYCSPCVHEFMQPPCNGDNQCMKNISVNQVMSTIEKLICNEKPVAKESLINYQTNNKALGYIQNRN
jgi:ADP-heptose:LPS heptosyltransferase